MKIADIANKNHVSSEHIMEICRDLGIPCENEDTDISDKHIFLVEKKIEVTKAQKAKKTLELMEKKSEQDAKSKSAKKIKLKRKVHVSKGLITEKPDEAKKEEGEEAAVRKHEEKAETKTHETAAKPAAERTDHTFKRTDKPYHRQDRTPDRDNKDRPQFRGRGPVKDRPPLREGAKRSDHILPKSIPEKDKESIKEHTKETSRKKLKGKVKGKEKDKYRKFNDELDEKDIFTKKKKPQPEFKKKEASSPELIEITENILVGDLAHKLNIKANTIIAQLMKLGVMATINQAIDSDTAVILAAEYNTNVKVVSLYEETVIRTEEEDKPEDRTPRPPIVTVMGHVDHGKTKLLDTIRETNVMDQEFGGITQHIGAYKIEVKNHAITFLDTPGHAAFTTMRARGAKVTDIVILVVAVNDGVMPQTIEAINHAKEAGVPVIVALNKIDLPEANPQKVRQELSGYGLAPEQWGGTTLYAEISAKNKINIEELLDLILIQAEMLELKANTKVMAKGTVLESRIDRGRGSVPTILVQNGVLKIGDPFVVGVYSGKVRAMFDDKGIQINEAGPSTPVEVLGISGVPSAGDPFQVVESEKYSKQISNKRQELKRLETAKKVKKVTLANLNEMIKEGEIKELKIIIKADVDGSAQALQEALEKLSTSEIRVKVIHSGAGSINDSDIMLASASKAITIGYHVRPTAKVADLAEKENVDILFFNIIFEATDAIKAALEGMLSPDIKEEFAGSGEVKQTFKISRLGTIAGSIVLKGKIHKNDNIRLLRDGVVVFTGKIKSLQRYKNEVSEVGTDQECGFTIEGFNDIKEGDTFEAYSMVEVAKTLD